MFGTDSFLNEKISAKENNFDFIRFLAASLVIFYHAFPLSGSSYNVSGALGSYAVRTFFFISGFLITKSWFDNPHLAAFISKRFLRIFPGLLGVLLFSIFIVGPVSSNLKLKEYFYHPQTFEYLKSIFLFPIRDELPGVFENNPIKNAVNGSLWTLPAEVLMYAFVAISGFLGILKRRYLVIVFLIAFIFLDRAILSKP